MSTASTRHPPGAPSAHLLVTNDFLPKVGGIQSYLWDLWRRLDPERIVVLTASSHPDAGGFDAAAARGGLRIVRVPERTLFFPSPRVLARVERLLAETGASLVVFDPVLPLGALGPMLPVPYGVVLHGAEAVVPAKVPGGAQLLAHVLRRASLIVSAGHYPAAEAEALLAGARGSDGAERRPVHVEVPPGVDCARYRPLGPDERAEARRRLGLPPGGPLVVSVSRLVPRKGMDVLVEAVRRLAPGFPDLVVAIAGSGREASRLEAQIRRSGAPARLLGQVSEEDKAALLGAADVFAMACRNRWAGLEQEGFGIVFLEAAAAGVPQVAGDSGGAADAVEDGVTGFVVRRPGEPGDVAVALRRLLADEGRRRTMGEAARRRACALFDHDALADKLAAALAQVQG